MIPPQVINCTSDAELRVFDFLKEVSFSPYDVALHSLNIGQHEYKRWGEADFLILSKRGILVLEVKGGRVACRHGLWEFTNRFEKTSTKKESPAAQASSAYFSLEKVYLKKILGPDFNGIPNGWGVVYPDIPRIATDDSLPLAEQPDEITAYDRDCVGHNAFRKYLDRCFNHWESKQRNGRVLRPELVTKLAQSLRPNFERVPSLNSQLRHVERELCQFTDEQYESMDEIAENERIFVAGGAGTGKTFIAAACARYEAAAGRTVGFVTRNPFLASFLRSHDFPREVSVVTFDQLVKQDPLATRFETLIIDEGQDLCDPAALDALERYLDGGWEKGRWRWFGDPNHQVSPSFPLDPTSYEFLRSSGFKRTLKQNIRNSAKVVEAIASFAGADVGKAKGAPGAGKVTITEARDGPSARAVIVSALKRWLGGEGAASRSEIVILVDDTNDPVSFAKEISKSGFRAEAMSERALEKSTRDCILVAGIEDFKGLERPLVCVVGLGTDPRKFTSNAYKTISRANFELVVAAPASAIAALTAMATSAKLPKADRDGM